MSKHPTKISLRNALRASAGGPTLNKFLDEQGLRGYYLSACDDRIHRPAADRGSWVEALRLYDVVFLKFSGGFEPLLMNFFNFSPIDRIDSVKEEADFAGCRPLSGDKSFAFFVLASELFLNGFSLNSLISMRQILQNLIYMQNPRYQTQPLKT